jgi:hypothetical protein
MRVRLCVIRRGRRPNDHRSWQTGVCSHRRLSPPDAACPDGGTPPARPFSSRRTRRAARLRRRAEPLCSSVKARWIDTRPCIACLQMCDVHVKLTNDGAARSTLADTRYVFHVHGSFATGTVLWSLFARRYARPRAFATTPRHRPLHARSTAPPSARSVSARAVCEPCSLVSRCIPQDHRCVGRTAS